MYEIICPACLRMVEVPAQVAVVGAHCKCPKCWALLEAVSDHPLRMVNSRHPLSRIVRSSSSAGRSVHAGSDD